MLKKLLIAAALLPLAGKAQTVSTFQGLIPAGQTDTFYVNYSSPKTDVGFDNGLAHFPYFTDTSTYMGFTSSYWTSGFAYSNKHDTSNGTYTNQYSAKPGKGFDDSVYAIAHGDANVIKLKGAAIGKSIIGFYVTNTTYAYNSIKNGDAFARKFGDTTGTHTGGIITQGSYPDYFKITVRGYSGGVLKTDSVDFFLADYTFVNNANDYIVKDWQFVNLLSLGHVDSIQIKLFTTVSNNYGPLTPSYYAIDNFTTDESGLGVNAITPLAAKVYPNPANSELHIVLQDDNVVTASIFDGSGREVRNVVPAAANFSIPLDGLPTGIYFLKITGKDGRAATQRFIKN